MPGIEYRVRWPKDFRPLHNPLHVASERVMEAELRAVWAILIEPAGWHNFYANARDVRVAGEPVLEKGSRFAWRNFGLNLSAVVQEFVPGRRIAWRQAGLGVRAYQVWLLREDPKGTLVRMEETFSGFVPRWTRKLDRSALQRDHRAWLDGMERGGQRRADEMKAEEEARAAKRIVDERERKAAEKAAREKQWAEEREWAAQQLAERERLAAERLAAGGPPLPAAPAMPAFTPEDDDEGWEE